MTFWLDAQLQPDLAAWLGSRFKADVKHVRDLGLREASDDVLMAAARRFGDVVIVTKDGEFVERVRAAGSPPRMVWLRCGNLTAIETQMWLSRVFDDVLAQLNAGNHIVDVPGPTT
jgi:predicted nuclease of predicted toxin-antitoxin system